MPHAEYHKLLMHRHFLMTMQGSGSPLQALDALDGH
jgi:hypothetical protein